MNKYIEIIVASDGSSRMETKGFAGPGCLEASRFLEQALGKVEADVRTAEFYQAAPQQITSGHVLSAQVK